MDDQLLERGRKNSVWRAAATSAALSALFFIVYPFCNDVASRRPHVATFYFHWEQSIPFVPAFVVPYTSMNYFFVAAPFLAATARECNNLARQITAATLICGICFLLIPLRFAFPVPAVHGVYRGLFHALHVFDRPFNEFPSLHVAYCLILANLYLRRSGGLLRFVLAIWFALIVLSTLFTYQHHVVDVVGGAAVAGICLAGFGQTNDRFARLPRQLAGISPFKGEIQPARVRLLRFGRGAPTLPFPHPWNYHRPLSILESFFWNAEHAEGSARHNRYLDVPGFAPVLVTRDPAVIRAIATETGDATGQFDRDTLPSKGIARATGIDTLLYANGSIWKRQKRLTGPPLARTTIFQPEQFEQFAETFRHTVRQRLEALKRRLGPDSPTARVRVEPEIKAVMLEMLANNFFGAEISYDEIRERYVPALERVIDHIVRDTVLNKLGIPIRAMPALTRKMAAIKQSYADFDRLTDLVLAPRKEGKKLWKQFKSDAPDDALRANIRVFLAGALEATTSYAAWAIFHLANHAAAQQRVYHEVKDVEQYTPDRLDEARYLCCVLNETLRLTPALYFLPRRATADCWVKTAAGGRLMIPKGTHILLDVWHANRHEDHWGASATGYPAAEFVPERWEKLAMHDHGSREFVHFGFGHGPRFCPGKNLGQLEVALVVGAFVKLFEFKAIHRNCDAKVGVSTKPMDGVLLDLSLRGYVPPRSGDVSDSTAINAERS